MKIHLVKILILLRNLMIGWRYQWGVLSMNRNWMHVITWDLILVSHLKYVWNESVRGITHLACCLIHLQRCELMLQVLWLLSKNRLIMTTYTCALSLTIIRLTSTSFLVLLIIELNRLVLSMNRICLSLIDMIDHSISWSFLSL